MDDDSVVCIAGRKVCVTDTCLSRLREGTGWSDEAQYYASTYGMSTK
jgi:hypothetical protein